MEKYVVLELIASGGDGDVFRGYDSLNDRGVVLKRYCVGGGVGVPTAMLREVSVLRKIGGNQRMIKLFEVVCDGNYIYLVLEIGGETLLDVVLGGGEIDKEKISVELIECINFLHSIGYVHGDLNLKNILVGGGSIKLIDFCSAIRFHRKGVVYDPMIYVCPYELVNGGKVRVKALDIWMLGCCEYFIATGELLFLSCDRETHMRGVKGVVERKSGLGVVKGTANNYIKRMLSINPFKRGTIGEVVRENLGVYGKFKMVPCKGSWDHLGKGFGEKLMGYTRSERLMNVRMFVGWGGIDELIFLCVRNVCRIVEKMGEYRDKYFEICFWFGGKLFGRGGSVELDEILSVGNMLDWDVDPYTMYDYVSKIPKNLRRYYVFLAFLLVLEPMFDVVDDIQKIVVVVVILEVLFAVDLKITSRLRPNSKLVRLFVG